MKIAILIFDKLTAHDAIGPYEVLRSRPRLGGRVRRPAEGRGAHRRRPRPERRPLARRGRPSPTSSSSPAATATGRCSRTRRCSPGCARSTRTTKWTTSVCTGSLVLGAAGLLEGKRATCNWLYLEQLREYGADPVGGRFVEDGKIDHRRRRHRRDRHGPAPGRPRGRPRGRPGRPARDRVRPPPALRRRLAREGAGGRSSSWSPQSPRRRTSGLGGASERA